MQVFLDMDGVLADYFTEVEVMMGVEHYSHAKFEEVVAKIKHRDWLHSKPESTFFKFLNKLPNANRLVHDVASLFGGYSIITTPLHDHEMQSMAGKILWIVQNLTIKPNNIIFTDNKARFAAPDRILIDDYRPNVERWQAAGGIALKYKALSKNYTYDDLLAKLKQTYTDNRCNENLHNVYKLEECPRGRQDLQALVNKIALKIRRRENIAWTRIVYKAGTIIKPVINITQFGI